MTAQELLSKLNERGAKLWAEGDQIRVRAPNGLMTTELKEQLARSKSAILEILRKQTAAGEESAPITLPTNRKPLQFSLFYFSSDEAEFTNNKYHLVLEGAKFADAHGFTAVWLPERHFHAFGGIYPNPSVISAAVAMVTENIRLRAGSVVLPLHNPIRVAEEWAVVDNLSEGRVDLAFARGWNPNDFVMAPDRYQDRTKYLYEGEAQVRRLWRGETITGTNGLGEETTFKIYPLPKQKELSTWITCSGGTERFIEAGASGANIITAILLQSPEELAEKIAHYRQARADHGHDPSAGHVTLMLHTFVGRDNVQVKETVRKPFTDYLKSSVDLWRQISQGLEELSSNEKESLFAYAFERYYKKTALFGTPESCLNWVHKLQSIGVDEIACLIDFGVDNESVLEGLSALSDLKDLANQDIDSAAQPRRVVPTPGQLALRFLHKMAPQSWAYNIQFPVRVRSEVDKRALQRGLQHIVERHECLRSTFVEQDNQTLQVIHPSADIALETVDAANWSDQQLDEQLTLSGRKPFDLETGPVLRATLFSRSATDHVLLLVVHHSLCDFWSLLVMMDELHVFYAAERNNQAAELPPLEISYSQYAQTQRDMLAGPTGEEHWKYWQQQLAGELPTCNLPTDKPRPSYQTYAGSYHKFRIPDELAGRIEQLAKNSGATMYMTLLAAFQVLLHRYTGQEDILVGSPTTGRTQSEYASIVGYFVNPVVMRADVRGNPTFRTFLDQIKQKVWSAIAHQEYPFQVLVERLQPKRDPSRTPLFQVAFSLLNPRQVSDLVDQLVADKSGSRKYRDLLRLEPFEIVQQEGQFDLTLEMESADSLSGQFKYNTDLFDPQTIERLAEHFQQLLASIAENVDTRVGGLNLLPPAERAQLSQWNNTQQDYQLDQSLHGLIEKQVEATPDAIAVRYQEVELTYRELDERTNRIAHYLISKGVQPDQFVGVYMHRSAEMILALVGILKAGAAYVPLNPEYPEERIDFMIRDADIRNILTQQALAENLPATSAEAISLDSQWTVFTDFSNERPNPKFNPQNIAYLIYTSGSTGQPKGVMVPHRAIVNRLLWMQDEYRLSGDDRVLQKTPFSFDVSVWEFFWPLIAGAELIFAKPDGHRDPVYLLDTIAEQKITTLHFVPSMLQIFLDQHGVEELTSLRRVICSGEALPLDLKNRFYARLGAELHNLYGPTEAAVDVTYWHCQPEDPAVPIGHPIANTQIHLLDGYGNAVPVGVPGELCIGGVNLARGYLNREELTAEKFVPDPFTKDSAAHLYRTGDLARRRTDGAIEFLGRLDFQVKIGGNRIELGEIETLLVKQPGIKEAVVMAREGEYGDMRLVAYLVSDSPQSSETESAAPSAPPAVDGKQLRAALKNKLPDYMIPAFFISLNELPLSSNGKLDRSQLPEPKAARPDLEVEFTPARNPLEEKLVEICQQVLGIDRVGVHDNFFDLGGASLQSLKVVDQAVEHGIDLAPEMLFQYQTIAELSEAIENGEIETTAP